MSIEGLRNTRPAAGRGAATGPVRAAEASFQDRLARTAASAAADPGAHLRMPGENTVYSGARGGKNGTFQEICAEYTADSTPEDPVVRVTGTADSGPFDFTCRVNDIDPSNASCAELAALYGHLVKTGVYRSGLVDAGVLPTGLESGDVTERRDYLGAIGRHRYDRHFGGVCAAQAAELLALYQPYASGSPSGTDAPGPEAFLREDPLAALDEVRLLLLQRTKEGREWKKEQEEWDRLMKCLDGWIDALRDAAEQRREGRSCAVTEEGGEAVLSMYRNMVAAAARAESAGAEPARSGEELLSALTAARSELLERLKEDRAAEEEREDWAELLRRLDRWIEALRGAENREEGRRPESVSAAAGPQEKYNT